MNIALHIEYNGSAYHGFQRQVSHLATIQATLETALSQIADAPIKVICAGRTDAGVHATAQMINFHTPTSRALKAWTLGVNQCLPNDIAVRDVKEMPEEFHARYTAVARTYRYIINNHPIRHGLWAQQNTHFPMPLDAQSMQQAANYLVGEHDFSAFRGIDCQARTPVRNVEFCRVQRVDDFIYIDIQANAFLHHMVRNIVGTLVIVGRHLQPAEWVKEVLASRQRRQAGITMPAQGLYLAGVYYPSPYEAMKTLIWPRLI